MARALDCRVSRRLSAIIERHEALAAVAGRRRAPSRLLSAREGVLRNRVRARASARLAAGAVGRHLAHSFPLRGHARMSSLSPEAYAVIEGRHSDPFRYLGPHVEGDVPLVRIFLPDAEGVAIVDEQGHERGLERIHDAGLFEGRLSNGSRRYRVRARYGERQVEIEDPYRFPPILSDFDLYLLGEGTHTHLYEKLGAHPMVLDEVSGVAFAVFAPNAQRVSVVGDFNSWDGRRHPMRVRGNGFWEIFLPVSEHPFDGSWGYQPTGLFAPTSRFGTPTDFAGLVDACHRAGLAVILDWVPGHFPDDPHGLSQFDGTAVYEHANPMQGRHLEWNTLVYNYARTEVANFLLANGLFWPDRYRIDGLRVDAVASMLYLDYSRSEGSWIPNKYGGRENLEAISLLRRFNTEVFSRFPNATTVAEESTAWPMVSKPVDEGGLGFGYKRNMGWMHEKLEYIGTDPIYRKHHHGQILFALHYAFSENFILPLS